MSAEDNGARLEKIQGGVDLINERLASANLLANERHEHTRAEIAALKRADELIDGRVSVLEFDKVERGGERKGLALTAKALWAIAGAIPVGLIAAALRAWGA